MVAMLTYSARMHRSPVPVTQYAAEWVDRLELMLTALVRDRDAIAPERSIDVSFEDYLADQLGVAEQVYKLIDEPMTADARTRITNYLQGHERGHRGKVVTSYEMFGLDENELRSRFTFYVERFLSESRR